MKTDFSKERSPKKIEEDFFREFNLAVNPDQFYELLIESSVISRRSEDYSPLPGMPVGLEKMVWEKVQNTLNWDGWETLSKLFQFYTVEAIEKGRRNWEIEILDYVEEIAKTPEQKEFVREGKRFQEEEVREALRGRFCEENEEIDKRLKEFWFSSW